MDNSRICHRLLFHERGKQYFVQSFLRSNYEATKGTHTLSLNFTLELLGEFLALMSVDYAWTYLKRTQLQCVICTVSSLPLSVMVRSCHARVVFVPWASFTLTLRSGSSPSPTRQWAGHIACTKGFHEIFKYAHFKFTVCGRSIAR